MKQILDYINSELKKCSQRPFLIAIDGNCGSGKTTLGNYLKEQLPCSLFHMDDFFLQPEQRTAERLSAPGGNVAYERFRSEILAHISDKDGLSYRIYDCHHQTLSRPVSMPYHDIVVIEGAYSQHPYFHDIYHLKIFLRISEAEQKKRILTRNGEERWKLFRDKWIPMENRYFEQFQIQEHSDYVYKVSDMP